MSSDISDTDEDFDSQPPKRANLGQLQQLASKGWNTRSLGFDGSLSKLKFPSQIGLKQTGPKSKPGTQHQTREDKVSHLQTKKNAASKTLQKPKNQLEELNSLRTKAPVKKPVLPVVYCEAARQDKHNSDDELDICSSSPEINDSKKENRNHMFKSQKWTFTDLSSSFANSSKSVGTNQASSSLKRNAARLRVPRKKNFVSRKKLSVIEEERELVNTPVVPNTQNSASPIISTDSSTSSKDRQQAVLEDSQNHAPSIEDDDDECFDKSEEDKQGNKAFEPRRSDSNKASANSRTGKEWLQSISWNKDSCFKPDQLEEKPHRHRKFVPGGFAEQASKLESRERTSRTIWSHKKTENSVKWLHKCLLLSVQSNYDLDGFIMLRCTVLKKPTPSPPSSCTSLESSPSSAIASSQPSPGLLGISDTTLKAGAGSLSEENTPESCMLLIKPSSQNTAELSCGSEIYVYPPWHSLKIPSAPFQIILCSYFTCSSAKIPPAVGSKNFVEEEIYSRRGQTSCFYNNPFGIPALSTQVENYHALKNSESSCNNISKWTAPKPHVAHGTLNQKSLEAKSKQESLGDSREDSTFFGDIAESYAIRDAFSISNPKICVSARVQRIWQFRGTEDVAKNDSQKPKDNMYLSLLLQDKNFRFCELQINNSQGISKDNSWYRVLNGGEGKCFQFENVQVSQKLAYSKHLYLFSLLNSLNEEQQKEKPEIPPLQPELYKVIAHCQKSSVTSISDSPFPSYTSCDITNLKTLLKGHKCFKRFSCVAKVICEMDGTFFLTDTSLRNVSTQYVKLLFHTCSLKPNVVSGSVIFVKEAAVPKGRLLADRCTLIKVLTPASSKIMNEMRKMPFSKQVFSLMKSVLFLDVRGLQWLPLGANSRVGELVTIEGRIVDVDKETAVSWLQCGSCSGEDLYEDTNYRIYCKKCDRVISKTVMFMKMTVVVGTASLQNASVSVELSSKTTKRLLNISDEEQQPNCTITDVLRKQIGPAVCYVKNRSNTNQKIIFKLCEVILT